MAQLDLFGETYTVPEPIERSLSQYDEVTRPARAVRFAYVSSIYPSGTFMLSVSMGYLLHEARHTYVNGDFAATILVAQAFIEHWLKPRAIKSAGVRAERWGMAAMIQHFRKAGRIHPYLLDRVDRLRRIRNPFVHMRPGDSEAIEWRSYRAAASIDLVLHRDARDALGLMYAIVVHVP